MSIASTLPPEVLLLIFENAVDYIPGFIYLHALHRAYERNATLAACALVCKSWAAPAQLTLFRDITLGITTNNVDEEEVTHNAYGERPGSTTPALANLVHTLEKFRDIGSPIPHSVRAVHLCIGETDTFNHNQNSDFGIRVDYIIHGSPAAVFRAIALCPGVVYLSITLGVYHEDDERSAASMFSAEHLDMLKGIAVDLPNLRQLSIQMPNDVDFIRSFGYRITSDEEANTIIAALSDRITLLDVSINASGPDLSDSDDDEDDADSDLSDDDEAGGNPIVAFPILHTFRSQGDTSNIRTTVLHHAPRLRRAVLPSYSDLVEAEHVVPDFVRELTLGSLREGDDLASFSQLETLELIKLNTDLPVLRTLPRTLRELVLPARLFEVEGLAQKLADELPNLQSITAVQATSAPAPAAVVVQQFCHLPVEVVPWTQRRRPWLISCADPE
ncbi:hypothetical protein EXIGLDRAFT_830434 [Exidia glandulosa HHB12029]|uniref:F-box domain-containing protein n=1 Tax=Exidia glandulosa HHB12029 TaxID=1314781 RepID=A0A165NHL3_EXIGL|nr:hypothetical protein EXIGLDRAFT_830434 [Exidia glandulosa HHB12029]